jgi:hypothetical protein
VDAAHAAVVLGSLPDDLVGAVERIVDDDDGFPVAGLRASVRVRRAAWNVLALAVRGHDDGEFRHGGAIGPS